MTQARDHVNLHICFLCSWGQGWWVLWTLYASSGQMICLQWLSCPEQRWRFQHWKNPQQGWVQRQRKGVGIRQKSLDLAETFLLEGSLQSRKANSHFQVQCDSLAKFLRFFWWYLLSGSHSKRDCEPCVSLPQAILEGKYFSSRNLLDELGTAMDEQCHCSLELRRARIIEGWL